MNEHKSAERESRSPRFGSSLGVIACGPREGWWMAWAFSPDAHGLINPGWLATKEQAEARLREMIDAYGGCGVVCQSVGVEQAHNADCTEDDR